MAMLFVVQDLYFYLTHRMLHLKPFMRRIHAVHHRSFHSNVWSSYSVHPIEKAIELLFFPLIIILVPMHLATLFAFLFLSSFINLLGHSGYELRWLPRMGPFQWKWGATSLFHDMHHSKCNGHFGLYFTFWDRLFKTTLPTYEERLAKTNESIP